MKNQFKNQIRSLQSVFFLLLVILGVNAFTTPTQDVIDYDITEGKILAAEYANQKAYAASLIPQFLQAQQDYKKMNIDFDVLASQSEAQFDELPRLSVVSQILYVYDQELKSVKFTTLNLEQRKALIAKLESIKKEFYKTIAALSSAQ